MSKACRILVVDDQLDTVVALSSVLMLAGYTVLGTCSSVEALAIVREHQPHAAFVDIKMPGLDGYDLARAIRAEFGGASPRLVAITGYGYPIDRDRALQAGFDLHLTKPADPDHILRWLDREVRPACDDGES